MVLEKEFMSDEPSELLEEQFIDNDELKEEVEEVKTPDFSLADELS